MKNVLFDSHRRLRNGWWILIFFALVVATRFGFRPLKQGLQQLGLDDLWLEPLPFLFILGVTWICVRLRRESLASVGFRIDARWLRQAAAGTVIGAVAMLAITALIWASGGISLGLDPGRSLSALGEGLLLFLFVALFEEALFRGFVFQRFVDGAGVWIAQLGMALLFAAAHWGNPGMEGGTQVVASIDIALGALLLGMAYLRTRSLALPVGIHLGWNWCQGHVLGFGVSGVDVPGWWRPEFHGLPEWLTGGAFGPESSVSAVLVDLVLLGLLWRWKGTVAGTPAEASGTAATSVETALAPGQGLG